MKKISHFRYTMQMGFGGDLWRPYGLTRRGWIYTSTPVNWDNEEEVMTTASGSKYKILSWDGDKDEIVSQIISDIENGGTEVN